MGIGVSRFLFVLSCFYYIINIFICKDALRALLGFKGLLKKSQILAILVVAVILDRLLSDGQWIIRTAVCYFYIANEGLSVLENAVSLGLPVPDKLRSVLAQLTEKKGKSEE